MISLERLEMYRLEKVEKAERATVADYFKTTPEQVEEVINSVERLLNLYRFRNYREDTKPIIIDITCRFEFQLLIELSNAKYSSPDNLKSWYNLDSTTLHTISELLVINNYISSPQRWLDGEYGDYSSDLFINEYLKEPVEILCAKDSFIKILHELNINTLYDLVILSTEELAELATIDNAGILAICERLYRFKIKLKNLNYRDLLAPYSNNKEILDKPLSTLGLPEGTLKCLLKKQINDIKTLIIHTPGELLTIPKLGNSSVNKIIARLEKHNLKLSTYWMRNCESIGLTSPLKKPPLHPEYVMIPPAVMIPYGVEF